MWHGTAFLARGIARRLRLGFTALLVGLAWYAVSFLAAAPAEAATFTCPGTTEISSSSRYAWNDEVGWLDFGDPAGCVQAGPPEMKGYASTTVKELALNCADWGLCATSNFKVLRSTSTNDLSGYAWNDTLGWVSFNCNQTSVGGSDTCSTSNYKVWVDTGTGKYRGWAWSDTLGWVSFNCVDPNLCLTSLYRVGLAIYERSGELTSAVFDTAVVDGAAYNTILWQGSLPSGTTVKFQFASSQCSNGATNPPSCNSGTWTYRGPDGTSATFYQPVGPNVPVQLNRAFHNNHRYYRYKAFLSSTTINTPRVDNVIVNWSP